MRTITIRAADSITALEQVERRLGPDAVEPKRVKYKKFTR